MQTVYGRFGFTFKLKLSTRPEEYLGDIETWDKAEKTLSEAMDQFTAQGGAAWELNPGDGAFYGPKIDITISDALKREYQCATIQLDFNLPRRFNLEYQTAAGADIAKDKKADAPAPAAQKKEAPKQAVAKTEKVDEPPANPKDAPKVEFVSKDPAPGYARPVMIHRAIYGSFERFIAILTEHFAGKWPFWLSPRQVLVVPVMPAVNDYVLEVQEIFRKKDMHVDVDISGNTMQKKIRTGQLSQYNFIFGEFKPHDLIYESSTLIVF